MKLKLSQGEIMFMVAEHLRTYKDLKVKADSYEVFYESTGHPVDGETFTEIEFENK